MEQDFDSIQLEHLFKKVIILVKLARSNSVLNHLSVSGDLTQVNDLLQCQSYQPHWSTKYNEYSLGTGDDGVTLNPIVGEAIDPSDGIVGYGGKPASPGKGCPTTGVGCARPGNGVRITRVGWTTLGVLICWPAKPGRGWPMMTAGCRRAWSSLSVGGGASIGGPYMGTVPSTNGISRDKFLCTPPTTATNYKHERVSNISISFAPIKPGARNEKEIWHQWGYSSLRHWKEVSTNRKWPTNTAVKFERFSIYSDLLNTSVQYEHNPSMSSMVEYKIQ